jgi:hypothetical protein
MASYATERKVKIIVGKLGEGWQQECPGESIDAVYNRLTGDNRSNLFSKVSPDVKDHLMEMSNFEELRMSEMLESIIEAAYTKFLEKRRVVVDRLANDFTGQ